MGGVRRLITLLAPEQVEYNNAQAARQRRRSGTTESHSMPGLKLMAELGLDGTGFESGMKKAEGLAISTLGSLKGFILAAIGIDAVKTAIHRNR